VSALFIPSFTYMVSNLRIVHSPVKNYYDSIFAGLAAIPYEPTPKKLLNCDWSFGSFILYARPDLKFVDLLDPYLIRFAAPEKFERLRRARLGEEPSMSQLASEMNSQYVICDEPQWNTAIEKDGHFQLIYSDQPHEITGNLSYVSPVRIYKLRSM
jgi:hypothetical protein